MLDVIDSQCFMILFKTIILSETCVLKFPIHKRRLMKLNLVKKTSASLLRQPHHFFCSTCLKPIKNADHFSTVSVFSRRYPLSILASAAVLKPNTLNNFYLFNRKRMFFDDRNRLDYQSIDVA